MSRIDAPKTGCAVQNPPIVVGDVMHALGLDEHLWIFLELPVRGERHPKRFEVIWRVVLIGGHGGSPVRPKFGPVARIDFCSY